MNRILWGNIVGLLDSTMMVWTGLVKKKKQIIIAQAIQLSLAALSNIILGGLSGFIISIIEVIRNVLYYEKKLNIRNKVIITTITILLVAYFNRHGVIGWLPVIAGIIYVWLMGVKDVVKLKDLIIFNMICWLIYDITIKAYVPAAFDFISVIANFYTIENISKRRKKREQKAK